jgi:hypothetical protein
MKAALSLLLLGSLVSSSCSRDVQAVSPQQLERQYGITDAYRGQIRTSDGALRGTVVPVTLPDGSRAELIIPDRQAAEPHAIYLNDRGALHPVALQQSATRQQLVQAPVVVERQVERPPTRHRSWEKELLIIGGSAGAGTAVGALTGGKKGAGIGAAAGGLGGLIYDLATRKK